MVGVGRFGRYETEVALDLPVTDGLALRVAGRAVNSDGYQKNVVTGKALGGETIRSMRLSAVWEPSEGLENYTVISWDDVEFNGPGHVLEAVNPGGAEGALGLFNGGPPFHLPSIFAALERAQGRDVHRVESDMDQLSTVKVWGVVNTTTLSLSDSMSVKSILAYRDLEAFETLDLDASLIPNLFTSWQTTEMEHASYEFQLLGSAWDNRLDWLAGLYWYYENGIEDSPGDVLEGVNPNTPFMQKAIMKNNSYSAFLHGNYRFDPAWTLSAGVRWTYDEKELTLNAWSPAGCVLLGDELQPLPMTNCFMPLSERFTQPTGTISLEYTPREEVMLYASSRLGYRAGGFNARGSQPIEYQPFDAETVLDLELGLKADWSLWNWQMRSNVALYHQWYDDIQRTVGVTNPVGVPGTAVENAAEAKVLGLEWEQTIMFTDRLSLQLSYAWLDPSYNEWREPATGADLSDTPFYFSPKHSASAILTYEYPLRSDDGVLWLSLSGAWRDDMWISPLNTIVHIRETPPDVQHTLKQDAYALFDLSVGWRQMLGSPVDLTAYVKNMTDQKYALGGIQTYHSFGLATRVYGEPRQYGVRLKYRF